MTDQEILHQMIRATARLSLEDHYGRKKIILTEVQQPGTSVTINGIPENAIVIKADAFEAPNSVFNGANGECKRADYVIIASKGNKKVILCIEMKKTKGSEKDIIQQFTGAHCFVVYCQVIGEHFWKHNGFLKDYEYRYVSIGHISVAKRKTRIERKSSIHDKPDKMMKIEWPHHLEFNLLAGGK